MIQPEEVKVILEPKLEYLKDENLLQGPYYTKRIIWNGDFEGRRTSIRCLVQ